MTELLHFTTSRGLFGVLRTGTILSRKRVADDAEVEFIFSAVWDFRSDEEWLDFVNLSITKINNSLHKKAMSHFGDEIWWAIVSIDPALLDAPGVHFATTNNKYDEVCERGTGVAGFEAMFKDVVPWGYLGSVKRRYPTTPENMTTDPQAEVLFPGEISVEHVHQIYVPSLDAEHTVKAWFHVLGCPEIPIQVREELF